MAFEPFDANGVRGFLHRADGEDVLVLTHSAGSDCRAPLLVSVADELAGNGIAVLRVDLPFRLARPQGPPGPGDAGRDREGLRAALGAARAFSAGRLFLGGHSYGGRQASMLAAAEPQIAAALLLLAYPLHPPRRPAELRTAHFPKLRIPALFVHGERDPFAATEELRSALGLIPAFTDLLEMPGAGHDLRSAAPQAAQAFVDFVNQREPVHIPITDVFDLHTVPPKDVQGIVEAYLEEARLKGLKALRIIHGRGIGVQREMVRAVLSRTAFVDSFGDAPAEAGGWGATIVTLR